MNLTEPDLEINITVTDKLLDNDMQTISFNIFQLIRVSHRYNKAGTMLGTILIKNTRNSVLLKLELTRAEMYRTKCEIYNNSGKQINTIIFSQIYNDILNMEFKNKVNEIIELIKQQIERL